MDRAPTRCHPALITLLAFFYGSGYLWAADIFRWVDEKGGIHFIDNLHNVPEKQRDSAEWIKSAEPSGTRESTKPFGPRRADIRFQKTGSVVTVPATINGSASTGFVVDTGATYTMISRAIASRLGIDLEKKRPTVAIQTANGIIQVPLANIDSIAVGGMEAKDITVAIHDVFPDSSIGGLLGINFLGNFRMHVDTKNGILQLEEK